MPRALREAVLEANLALPRHRLAPLTWGNASGVDWERGLVVIKPSGVAYERLTARDLVAVDLYTGQVVEGELRPSSDTPTHLALYRAFPQLGGVVHTHSRWATVFAQAGREIPPLGTTHADYFYGSVPVAGPLSRAEVEGDYEANTGAAIVRRFEGLDPAAMPAVLVQGHGPFAWGATPQKALEHAVVLEEVAMMAWHTLGLRPDAEAIPSYLLDRHYRRKHGAGAYYGQKT